jgi:hypothetical protein
MKHILIALVLWLFFFPTISMASTSSIPFTHKETYGTWKRIVGSGPNDPLYVSFQKNYGMPDANGTFFDSAKIAVLEPPKSSANYASLLDFMTPKPFTGDKSTVRLENDLLTFSEVYLGGAKGKLIRGTARLIYINNMYPVTNMLAKGYFFDTPKGIIEVLVQIRSAKGDILKIEQDVDIMVNSFRFGLPEDIALIRLIKTFKPGNIPINPPKQEKKTIPATWIYYGLGIIGAILLVLILPRIIKLLPKKKLTKKQRRKNKSKNS